MTLQSVPQLTSAQHAAQVARVLAAEIRDPRAWKEKPAPREWKRAA